MTTAPRLSSGPAIGIIDRALRDIPEYQEFRAGRISREQYCRWLHTEAPAPAEVGLNADQLNLSTRIPVDERAAVHHALETLRQDGIIAHCDYPEAEFDAWRERVDAVFEHADRCTYIFPEEARLLFALSAITAPARTVFPGSYYGYWAIWALPGIRAAGGTATLVDIDQDTMALAERNLRALGLKGSESGVEYVVSCAIAYGRTLEPGAVDLCVIDAEGPSPLDAPADLDPRLIDKAIYEPIMETTTPALRPGGLLVAHNMLLANLTDNAYFRSRIARNEEQYAGFQRHLDAHYDAQRVLHTSEGSGVYRRMSAGGAR